MESARCCCSLNLQTKAAPITSLNLSIIHWSLGKIWHGCKSTCSKSNPVQSSRFKSTTCPRKGRVLRFELNSSATSDGDAQKLGNYVRRDSESIATKVQPNRSQMKCYVWKPCSDPAMTGRGLIFDLKVFLAICLCKHSSTVLLTNHKKSSCRWRNMTSHILFFSNNWYEPMA